jgi:hypothetical protein
VSRSFAVTVAAAMALPVASVTLPDKVADTCAPAETEHSHHRYVAITDKRKTVSFIVASSSIEWTDLGTYFTPRDLHAT